MYHFETDPTGFVNVWTDGACLNNGKDNPLAGYGVFFAYHHPANLSRPVPDDYRQTNNVAEILAAKHAIINARKGGVTRLRILTDSKFMLDCVVRDIKTWKNNGWYKTNGQPVVNRRELIELDEAMQWIQIFKWEYVPAHSNNPGNEMADKFAKEGALKLCEDFY